MSKDNIWVPPNKNKSNIFAFLMQNIPSTEHTSTVSGSFDNQIAKTSSDGIFFIKIVFKVTKREPLKIQPQKTSCSIVYFINRPHIPQNNDLISAQDAGIPFKGYLSTKRILRMVRLLFGCFSPVTDTTLSHPECLTSKA